MGNRRKLKELQREVERLKQRIKIIELSIAIETKKREALEKRLDDKTTKPWTPQWTWDVTTQVTDAQKLMSMLDDSYRRLNRREDKDVDL